MKKAFLIILFCFVFIFCASAARTKFYFDAGIGFGNGKTSWNYYNLSKGFPPQLTDLGIEAGGKIGIAPKRKMPLFLVMDLDWTGHRFIDDYGEYIQYSSVLFGPGLVYYPKDSLQLAATAGISVASYKESWTDAKKSYEGGVGWSTSAALDIGGKKKGTLLGVKYLTTFNDIIYWDDFEAAYFVYHQKNSVFSVFVRFVSR